MFYCAFFVLYWESDWEIREFCGDFVVTIDSSDFFDEIVFGCYVFLCAERGDFYFQVLAVALALAGFFCDVELESGKDVFDVFF